MSAIHWGQLYGCSAGYACAMAASQKDRLVVIITPDTPSQERLEHEICFFSNEDKLTVLTFPDRETLPYDAFSPHQDIISQRLETLARLPDLSSGILIIPASTAMNNLPPKSYIQSCSLFMATGDKLDIDLMRKRFESSGYRCVSQVIEHGEFAVRGSLIDVYPMGSRHPFRIDLMDDEIESIRFFDPDNQRSIGTTQQIRLLPAQEFPMTDDAITRFRQQYRSAFPGESQQSIIYREVSQGSSPAGIEYYLPLFFENTHTLFDYLPTDSLVVLHEGTEDACDVFWQEINERFELRKLDMERPPLPAGQLFIDPDSFFSTIENHDVIKVQTAKLVESSTQYNFSTRHTPALSLPPQAKHPLSAFLNYQNQFQGRILIVAETTGRRETLLEMLHDCEQYPTSYDKWQTFFEDNSRLGIAVATLDQGMVTSTPAIAVITESQLFGEHVMQRRRRKKRERDVDAVIRNLTELEKGSPVVHEEHGVGRFEGMQTLSVGGITTEYLTMLYAGNDRLYIPVSSLHLISRYTGVSPDQAPLHKLGTDQWQKARKKASKRVNDVAAELLDLYARRAARKGHAFLPPDDLYATFASAFPFEETPDQQEAIDAVLSDMTADKPMDRLVCGDVGFGKTEVAMRAAFIAVHGGFQVGVLVPTTLLAQQHYQNMKDRFADLPVRIEVLSRFKTKKQQDITITDIEKGKVDIIIGTHKLIQSQIKFKNLGLIIIDEEHRFGVKQKESLKALRADVDTLALTATPIPRTLNMALSGLRDLSIIATPPLKRLAIKTFVREWNDTAIQEACQREIRRGGQIYLLHNEVRTIENTANKIAALLPQAEVRFAHGQMRERELEQIMLDFYHHRFNVLVCSTIIESGIDIPNANTMIINRADKLGLAQLYQIRGRVGRSHHQAYAFLLVPPRKTMTPDAVKRLEAIESIEDLGAGFTLATHDLEIRGAGEFLGDEQSGHIQEIGFSMYTELLERAVNALKSGKQPVLNEPLSTTSEIDLREPALIPEDYLGDVHTRLVMYKRIASAQDKSELDELQVEMIDRFGLLPDATKNLIRLTELKLVAAPIGVTKIDAGKEGGRIVFNDNPGVDPAKLIILIQTKPKSYQFDGKNKLRFTASLPDFNSRIAFISELLSDICTDQTVC
ncbi:MAG: transcription-repair coupling factor [Gammaproteobacteria bacterium]